jgi:hypothetical protein
MSVKDRAGSEPHRDPLRALGRGGVGALSMEVRWIHAGRLPSLLIDQLGPFRQEVESREDWYLTAPGLPNLSIKTRGGAQLDVKAFRGCPGQLLLPDGTRGRLEVWEKWSFPLADGPHPWGTGRAWTRVEKARRRRSFAAGESPLIERALAQAEEPGSSFELTEIGIDGEVWWTLGLEALGRRELLQQGLQATAMTFINDRVPTRFRLDTPASMSYQQHLRTRRLPHSIRR